MVWPSVTEIGPVNVPRPAELSVAVPVIDGRLLYIDVFAIVMSIVKTDDPPGAVSTLNTGYLAVEMRKGKGARILIVLEVDKVFDITGNTVNSSLRAPPIMIGFATPANVKMVPTAPTFTVFVPVPIVITELLVNPDIVFVIMEFAEKLPPESLATIVLLVFALVAFTVQVTAEDPLKVEPLRYPAPMIELDT